MAGEHRADQASQLAALTSIAGKIVCTTATLYRWCRDAASLKPSWRRASDAGLRVAINHTQRLAEANFGRGDRIRTCDPLVPNQMRYQAAPLPERLWP
jgi:hypothetical protein